MRLPAALALLVLATSASAQDGRTPLPAGVDIVTREEWGGGPPVGPMVPQTPMALTSHHSGTPMRPELAPDQMLRNLYAFSTREDTLGDGRLKKAWADIPYHFAIAPDGTILEARDVAYQGDTNTVYDLGDQILVELEGNFEIEQPTDAQMASLLALSEALARQWGFGPATVAGHRDRAPGQTVCPGEALIARFPEIRAAVAKGARQSVAGTWTVEVRSTPDAAPETHTLTLSVRPGDRLAGTFDGSPLRAGRVDGDWDAAHIAFATRGPEGTSMTHGVVRAGRLEATTTAPDHTLTVWTADRAE